jgi:hypothetical protein
MKIYRVYTINPLGEKAIELETKSSFDADLFLAQIDGAYGWDWDYGIDEENIDDMFAYFLEYEDWDFGPDEATGEPTAWPVLAYKEITREKALSLIREGRRNEIAVRMIKGHVDRLRLPGMWRWDDNRKCIVEDMPF